ncbi:DegT/DnrJ/EryC1/StrS family aminotransferase [Priestia aryabhattai]|nr:DegT/DnrJ/EryC1/StrS family aminotransferase [Priestia aryabhattai]
MRALDERVESRINIFNLYHQKLSHLKSIDFMPELPGTLSNRWLTTILIHENDFNITATSIIEELEKKNIEARVLWNSLYSQLVFNDVQIYSHTQQNVSEYLFKRGIYLPSRSNIM